MHIITWNINGLRAAFNKQSLEWALEQRADILCFQEIKSRPEQLTVEAHQKLDGYIAQWNPAVRPGYSGVATLSKTLPEEYWMGLDSAVFDVEGRVICTRQAGFLLFNIYFPNGQRDQGRLDFKLNFYALLLELCDRLHQAGEQIVICGDFNTAHHEIDLRNARQNVTTSGFLPEERIWIDHYLEHGFVDAYRHLYPDRIQYTWWTYISNARARNVGWRLDYFMVSAGMMNRVQDVVIHDEILGSDHCPVSLILK